MASIHSLMQSVNHESFAANLGRKRLWSILSQLPLMINKSIIELRNDARDIFMAGLQAVDPVNAIKRVVKRSGQLLDIRGKKYNLDQFNRVIVVGAGKAGAPMAKAIEDILGDKITEGHVNVRYGHLIRNESLNIVRRINIHEAGHPVPDQQGLEGARAIFNILDKADAMDLVICLISGGGSALLPFPVDGISLAEKQQTTSLLLSCGASIHEINSIRKHISLSKGGMLAKAAFPASTITLVISDVIGDPLDTIASGPTMPDTTTFSDCMNILKKYGIINRMPAAVLEYIKRGVSGLVKETPKPGDRIFDRVFNLIIANNMDAITVAKNRASALGYNSMILSTMIAGETREVARALAAVAKEIKKSGNPIMPPACVISGGETTVTLRGKGLGGRNQEFVLTSAIEIAGLRDMVILSAGTDGTDGQTDAAGALADGDTVERALKLGLNPLRHLQDNDSYHFFQRLGDLLITCPTNTNVMDIRVILVG